MNQIVIFCILSCADSTFEPPAEWSVMQDSENLAVVQVKTGATEYSSVIDKFQAKVGKREIVKVRLYY